MSILLLTIEATDDVDAREDRRVAIGEFGFIQEHSFSMLPEYQARASVVNSRMEIR